MPKLLVTLPNSGVDQTYDLAGEIVTIGRAPDNKVQIGHESISSHHAQLVRKNGHYQLKDLSSTRTSCVNGAPVTEAILKESCILRFGAVECVFREETPANTPDPLSGQLAQIESLLRARDASHEQTRELIKQRDQAQEDREVLSEEISDARACIENLQKDLAGAAAEKQALIARLEEAGHLEGELRLLNQDSAGRMVEAERRAEQAQLGMEQLRSEKDQALKQCAESKEARDAALVRLAESEIALTELTAAREQVEQTAAELSERTRERDELAESLGSAQLQKNEATEQVARVQAENSAAVAAAREELETTQRERAEVEEKLREREMQFEALSEKEADHANLLAETEKLRRHLADAHLEHKSFAKRTHELNSTLEALRSQSADAQTELEAAESAKRDLETRLAGAHAQLDKARQESSVSAQELSAELAQAAHDLEAAQHEAQQAVGIAAELSKTQMELAAANGQRKAAEKQQADLWANLSELQKQMEGLGRELEGTRRHDQDLVQQLAQVREQFTAESQEVQSAQQLARELESKLSEREKELATARSEREVISQENLGLAGKVEAQTVQLATFGKTVESAHTSSQNLQEKLANAQQRLHELSDASLAQQARAVEDVEQIKLHKSEIRELTKQREALLETTRRLAAERELPTAGGTQDSGVAPEASLAAPAPPPTNGNQLDEPSPPARPELASWLKRAFQRGKHTASTEGSRENARSAPRFSTAAPEHLNDSHAVSLDFLGATGTPAQEITVVEDSPDAAEEKPVAEEILSLVQSAQEPAAVQPCPDLLRPVVPELIVEIRCTLQYFIRHTSEIEVLNNLLGKMGDISGVTAQAGYPLLHVATSALEALFKDLYTTPSRITPATIRTLCQSIDFLHTLLDEANLPRLANAPVLKAIAIEDEPEVLEGIVAALETVKLRTCAMRQAKPALALLSAQRFDLIILDVGLPDMNGIKLCAKIRGMAQHRVTPIVFLTGMTTVEHRAQSTLHGGNDFVAKPFYLSELSMKAATWMLKGYLGMV